ncbi:hypothetical protein Nepgr_029849 [Nepenthes gracilis]|uniref:Uncharacterized protein n=1 Tax=Nepenthes gracilis TaxID=150966 RepID=A0AAD3Y5Y7_NEPGR|nr:hypothetical protein Nepgr_029849 [Nepenthes gracilis]
MDVTVTVVVRDYLEAGSHASLLQCGKIFLNQPCLPYLPCFQFSAARLLLRKKERKKRLADIGPPYYDLANLPNCEAKGVLKRLYEKREKETENKNTI